MEDAASPSRPVHEELAALRRQVADLQAAQEMAAQIVETVREPLLVLTPDFRVQSANPAFYQMFQVTPAETVGQPIYSIQEKDFPNTKVKQPGPSRLAGCRARVFLPVYE
jgi:PAS domain-containing protein